MQNQIQNTSQAPAVISQAIKDYTAKHKIPEEGLTILGGKPYLNYTGLIFKAKSLGLKSIKVELLKEATPTDLSAKAKATVVLKDGSEYDDFGFGSNTSIKMSTLHSADYINMTTITRAKNRALRSATGVGLVSAEEMEGQPDCYNTGQDNASKLLNKKKEPEQKKAIEGKIVKSEPEKKEEPKKITMAEGGLLLSAIKQCGSNEDEVFKFYGVENIYEFTEEQALDLSKKLKAKDDAKNKTEIKKIEDQDKKIPIEEMPPATESKAAKTMRESKAKAKQEIAFKSIPGNVCKIVNKLSELHPDILTKEQLILINDCNTGEFKGEDSSDYKGIFTQTQSNTK